MALGLGMKHCGDAGAPAAPRSLSLEVLPSKPAKRTIAKSRTSKWRAAVLITVNVLMLAHLAQWLWSREHGSGKTISPVEPSESMYTIELGQLNAGFVFFALALLATFIFGRFFCGWGCHIVSLQDLCSHWMNRLGVRPRPFRSRLLLFAPTMLALYMFAWPTFKRLAVLPLENALFARYEWRFPEWLIELPRVPHPGFSNAFVVEDFWHTFPKEWYIIVPFLLTVGFAAVYFLGSKGFCTYGCPYGGLFAPLDKLSVGRIVVNDQCEGCGHCTAVCTSNVQVAQEVRDFGMVVDPGCMKCMDCVSVCPNDALSFSFARPAVLAKPRTQEAKEGKVRRPEFDLTWWQDILLMALVIVFFIGFRQMFNKIPLLMAAGMGLAGGFLAWKVWTLITEPNVRLQSLQLKLKGRLKPLGLLFMLLGLAYLAWGAWGAVIQGIQFAANRHDIEVRTPTERVFSAGYKPSELDASNAARAIELYKLADSPGNGGIGWAHAVPQNLRLAWLHAVAGNLEQAEVYLRRGIDQGEPPSTQAVFQLAEILSLRGKSGPEVRAELSKIVDAKPELYEVQLAIAQDTLSAGGTADAVARVESVLNAKRPGPDAQLRLRAAAILLGAGQPQRALETVDQVLAADEDKPNAMGLTLSADILMQAGQLAKAEQVMARGVAEHPESGFMHFHYARTLAMGNKFEQALQELVAASKAEPGNPQFLMARAELLNMMGRGTEAQKVLQEAQAAAAAQGGGR